MSTATAATFYALAVEPSGTRLQRSEGYAQRSVTSDVIRRTWAPPSLVIGTRAPKVIDTQATKEVVSYRERVRDNLSELIEGAAAARMFAMTKVLAALTDLLTGDWGYEDDNIPPTRDAFTATWNLLADAALLAPDLLAMPDLGPLGDGGLSMQWGDKSRYVRLLMPPDPSKAYLYSKGVEEKRSEPATPEVLARRLAWLNQG